MKIKPQKLIYGLSTLLLLGSSVAYAVPTIVTVTSADPAGWFEMDAAGAATGAVTTNNPYPLPDGTGSLEFTTSGDQADIINAARIPLTSVDDIVAIGYHFSSDNTTTAPSLKLQYWSLQRFGTLVYEPYIQSAGYPPSTWVNADDASATGLWWSTENGFGPLDMRSFADWQIELGNVAVTFLQTGVGSGWASPMTGFVDLVHLQTSTSDIIWDFEGEIVLPAEPKPNQISVDDGYVKLDVTGGLAPSPEDCADPSQYGRMVVDEATPDPSLWICVESGWRAFQPAGGGG